jgi:probable rRNA maturation factor
MITFSFGKSAKIVLPRQQMRKVLGIALKATKSKAQKLEVRFVRSAEMQKLNRAFRGKNKTTDVLSFPSASSTLLGSIVIDLDTAAEQAGFYQHSLRREICELYVHGLAHLLGHDHENSADARRMKKFENELNRGWTF